MDPTKEAGILIGQVFVERVEFSHREDFLALSPETKPEVGDMEVRVEVAERSDGKAGLIRITVRTNKDLRPVYNVSLAMVALVGQQEGKENLTIREYIQTGGVALLYPFVRETLASLTLRGRFGPVFLNPINTRVLVEGLQEAATAKAAGKE